MDWKQQLEEKFSGKNMRQDLAYLVVGKRKGWQNNFHITFTDYSPLFSKGTLHLSFGYERKKGGHMEDPCGRNEINGANKNKRKAEDSQKTARKNRKASEKEIALYVKYGFTRKNAILASIIDHKRKTRN